MQLMGSNISTDTQGFPKLDEIDKAGNVALVFVTANVPIAGAQQGDTMDCTISAISAKSLDGGILMLTPLLGPRRSTHRLRFSARSNYAFQPRHANQWNGSQGLQNGGHDSQ